MYLSDNVVDFTLFRKRRQAKVAAQLMWALYTSRAGLSAMTVQMATVPINTRQA